MKNIARFFYLIYFLILLYYVICKFQDSYIDFDGKRVTFAMETIKYNKEHGLIANCINLIPFKNYYEWITMKTWDVFVVNLVGNTIAFIPMGFFETYLSKSRTLWKVVLKCFLIVLFIEIFQISANFGYFDIDDIILNTFGCLLGYYCFKIVY